MVKDIRYIIKRIIIGVGIAFILGYLSTLTGFIVPVYAETESGGGGGASLVQSKPEPIIGVDTTSGSNSTISTMHGLSSNAFIEGAYEYPELGLFQYGVNGSLCNEQSGLCPLANSPTPQYYTNQLNNFNDFVLKGNDSSNVFVYGSNIYFNFDTSIKIKNGNHYTLLLEFTKNDDITYFAHKPNMSISTLNVTNDPQHFVNIDISSNLSNISINWARFTSDLKSTNWAFLLVEFDVDNVALTDIYLQDMYITFNDGENPSNVQPIPLPNLMFNNTSNDLHFFVDSYFIENGSIQFNGWNCDYVNDVNSCYFSENYFDPDYDYTYASDIRVFDNITACADNDFICHIKQNFEMLKSIFVRFSNFFRELLNDSFDVDLESNNDMTPVSNIVNMPITILNRFIDGFNNQCYTFNLGILLGTNLFINCVDVQSYLGQNLWFTIDILISIFMCINIMSLILMFFDKWTSFEDTFALMYYPKNSNNDDYQPKHAKE